MATTSIKVSPAVSQRLAYFKDIRTKPMWLRTLIQRICFVPERPMRPFTPGQAVPYAAGRAARQSHQQLYKEWKENFQSKRPIVFWLTETLPRKYTHVVEAIENVWDDVTSIIDNIFVQRADRFTTGLKRWEFETADESMLYANFHQFELYVETVYSLRYIRSQLHRARKIEENPQEIAKWEKINKQAKRYPLIHWKKYRNKEYALQYMHMQLDMPIDEYDGADEIRRTAMILAMYVWWTQVRPNRGESGDASGLNAFRAAMCEHYGDQESWTWSKLTADEQEEYRKMMVADDELEKEWLAEDTEMLVKLVKERQNIWY